MMPFLERAPTLAPVLRGAAAGARRFPLAILAGLVAATTAILLTDEIGPERTLERLILSAILGIPLFTGVRLLGERLRWRLPGQAVAALVALGMLAGFFAGASGWSEPVRIGRFLQLGAVFGLLVTVAPFVVGREGPAFWTYNATLATRVIRAFIYALVLFVGAVVALLALDNLFGVPVPPQAYARLWFIAALFLAPWFFLADVPADVDALEGVGTYPPELRAFTRFALLPIVAIYLLILQAYFVKVLVTWAWPSGWIGWLVSAVAIAGILSLVLVHPLLERPGEGWVRTYARGFYAFLLPAIMMLWLAIWQRVAQYGVTERRYFLIVLSVWLAGIALHQLFTRARGIRIIPASLALIVLVTFAGPWSAYAVSERSQVARLAGILERHGMLAEGRVSPAPTPVPEDDRGEIAAILRYLSHTHGLAAIAPWFADSARERVAALRTPRPGRAPYADQRDVMALLSLPSGPDPVPAGAFRLERSGVGPVPIGGFDLLLPVRRWTRGGPAPEGWSVRGDTAGSRLVVFRDGEEVVTFPLEALVRDLVASGTRRGSLPAERLRVSGEGSTEGLLLLETVAGRTTGDRAIVTEVVGEVLLRLGLERGAR